MAVHPGRRLLALLTSAAMAAGLAVTVPLAAPSAAASSAASIAPPIAQTPVESVAVGCAAGQVDFNTATAQEVSLALQDITGDAQLPVAERIVAGRLPFYASFDDLLVVDGIGPGKRDEIQASGRVCFGLPAVLPPVDAANVCRFGDARVDVNRLGSRSALAKIFGPVTAQRIVDAAPFTGTGYVRAERIGGAGQGRMDKQMSKICYTPPTVDAGATRFGWVNRGTSRVDHSDGASLTVPAGVLDTEGAWATIAPEPFDEMTGGPRFNLHVHGPWAGETDKVFVALPPDPFVGQDLSAWTQTVVHDTAAGEQVHALGAVGLDRAGRLVTQTGSLSSFQSVSQPVSTFAFLAPVVVVPKTDLAEQTVRRQASADRVPGTCDPDVTRADPAIFSLSASHDRWLNGMPGLMRAPANTCAQGSFRDGSLYVNTTNTGGLAYTADLQYGSPAVLHGIDYTGAANLFMRAWMQPRNGSGKDHGLVHGPGTVITLALPVSDEFSHLRLVYDVPATMALVVLERLSDADGDIGDVAGFVDCVSALEARDMTPSDVVACAETAAKVLPIGHRGRTSLKSVGRALSVFDGGQDLLESVGAVAGAMHNDGVFEGTVHTRFKARPKPTADAQGRAVPAHCLRREGAYWSVDQACSDAYYANGAGLPGGTNGTNPAGGPDGTIVNDSGPNVLHRIGPTAYLSYDAKLAFGMPLRDPGVYACLSQRYLLRDWLPASKLLGYHVVESVVPAVCDESIPELPALPSNATNWILRESNGTAWLVDGNGDLRWIKDGGTYQCLAQRHYVRDNTPWSEIAVFEADVYPGDATCP